VINAIELALSVSDSVGHAKCRRKSAASGESAESGLKLHQA
jgi:hypothetical protein